MPLVAMMQFADLWKGDNLELQRGAASEIAETAFEETRQDLSHSARLREVAAEY